MKEPKLTKRQKQFLLKDEGEAVKRYNKLGFPELAKDEAKHKKFLQKQKTR